VAEWHNISRSAAQELIRDGYVQIDGHAVVKPSAEAKGTISVCMDGGRAFVGRGGDKLESALQKFALNIEGCVCLDVGASTGGFTDCMLKRGAAKVYAVENGKGQLAKRLLDDTRVVSMEDTDIRLASKEWFDEPISFAAVDVSFISLTKVMPSIIKVLVPEASLICLIKPQYEVGKENLSKRGIVRDAKIRQRAVDDICKCAEENFELILNGVIPYLSKTPQRNKNINKNQEFLAYFRKKVNNVEKKNRSKGMET